MFTGLVEAVLPIQKITPTSTGKSLTINLGVLSEGTRTGDSICVNGVCLTVSRLSEGIADFDVMNETLRVSTLGGLRRSQQVNLERAMPADGRFGGHLVQGHVDGIGKVVRLLRDTNGTSLWIGAEAELIDLMIPKGSVTINGVSLTLVDVEKTRFSVYLIPTTMKETNLTQLQSGDSVNLEADLISKWIKKRIDAILPEGGEKGLTMEKLRNLGFG
jgi:riboflavin synthase